MDDNILNDPTNSTELSMALFRLGLNQYEDCLKANGFEDMETVTAITESDLAELGFKLGDRRKLQRAIQEHSNSSSSTSPAKELERIGTTSPSSSFSGRPTRRYRRHPRPDPNAPVKPKRAYVLFREHVRQDPALKHSSFAELAKETGKRWRGLSNTRRSNIWERPAAEKLQAYKEDLDRYMQTENYRSYQQYLDEFKQGRPSSESAVPSSYKDSSSSESTVPLPASLGHEELESTHNESSETINTSSFDDLLWESQSEDSLLPVHFGMEEVRYVSSSLSIDPRSIRGSTFPPEDQTANAVQAFIHGTGSLLYFWNQDEASKLVESVYHPENDSAPVHATEVFAMAAVGSYCDGETMTTEFQERLLHLFLSMLSSPSDTSDLHHMRLFACLAICRFMTSTQSARRLMCKQLMLFKVMQ
jgi:hypothetical protein